MSLHDYVPALVWQHGIDATDEPGVRAWKSSDTPQAVVIQIRDEHGAVLSASLTPQVLALLHRQATT